MTAMGSSPLVTKFPGNDLNIRTAADRPSLKSNPVEEPAQPTLPANFGEVVHGIYRSSYPNPRNLPALKKLGLKTIITLVEEQYSNVHISFLLENGINHRRILIEPNKDPNVKTPETTIIRVLELLLDRQNHPVLVHCNKGRHRTGCIIGCFRKVQGWPMHDILSEYHIYADPKARPLDEKFITSFDHTKLKHRAEIIGATNWKPSTNHKLVAMSNGEQSSSDKRHVHSSLSEVSMPKVI